MEIAAGIPTGSLEKCFIANATKQATRMWTRYTNKLKDEIKAMIRYLGILLSLNTTMVNSTRTYSNTETANGFVKQPNKKTAMSRRGTAAFVMILKDGSSRTRKSPNPISKYPKRRKS